MALPVLADPKRTVRKSRMGPRRAIVLVTVHVLIAVHILSWYFGGKRATISPVEPSESMYTLDKGELNAGFIFFGLAIIATAVLGRFFCGWGCHIVALQDFCGWLMKKCGVHPKPFRSRLLAWAPLVLALYMFFWPTFKREVIKPLAGEHWQTVVMYLDGPPPPRPQLKAALTKTEFWETFESRWYVIIPFLAVCGFATVYFLGAKGFCSYGCPYGGFFFPADRLAVGRIRVTDACEHCGHCTAVCTSNVRVHEEVRDYGMVVDPGCMKCMDCVSVCPNDALYFGLGKPEILAKPRTDEARARGRPKRPPADLSWPEEIAFCLVGVGLFLGFRGMLGGVPLLMAVGMAGIGAFLAHKLYALIRTPSVRLQNLQLKIKGRFTAAGALFGALAAAVLVSGGWGLARRGNNYIADIYDQKISAPYEAVFSPGYQPSERDRRVALAALAHYRRADSFAKGGYGWALDLEAMRRTAWLHAVAGQLDQAQEAMASGIVIGGHTRHGAPEDLVRTLGIVLHLRGQTPEQMLAAFQGLIPRTTNNAVLHLAVAHLHHALGRSDEAAASAERAIAMRPTEPSVVAPAVEILASLDRIDPAAEALERVIAAHPGNAGLHANLGGIRAIQGREQDAIAELRLATQIEPRNPVFWGRLQQVCEHFGRAEEAQEAANRAAELMEQAPGR